MDVGENATCNHKAALSCRNRVQFPARGRDVLHKPDIVYGKNGSWSDEVDRRDDGGVGAAVNKQIQVDSRHMITTRDDNVEHKIGGGGVPSVESYRDYGCRQRVNGNCHEHDQEN